LICWLAADWLTLLMEAPRLKLRARAMSLKSRMFAYVNEGSLS